MKSHINKLAELYRLGNISLEEFIDMVDRIDGPVDDYPDYVDSVLMARVVRDDGWRSDLIVPSFDTPGKIEFTWNPTVSGTFTAVEVLGTILKAPLLPTDLDPGDVFHGTVDFHS